MIATTQDPDGVGWALYGKATIRIFVAQIGGDGSKLTSIANGYNCTTSNLRGCVAALRALSAYQRDDLSAQLDVRATSEQELGGWAVVAPLVDRALLP